MNIDGKRETVAAVSLTWINLSDYVHSVIATNKPVGQIEYDEKTIFSLALRSEFWLRSSLSVCFAVWKNRHMRTVTNYFIVNLSFADVLVTIICLPASLVVDITETWFFGNTLCKIVPYLQVCDYSDTQSLIRSAVDWLLHTFTFVIFIYLNIKEVNIHITCFLITFNEMHPVRSLPTPVLSEHVFRFKSSKQ